MKRADDPTNAQLGTLIEQQAATIQNLQARLETQENTIQTLQATVEQQGASLRSRMDTQEGRQLMEDNTLQTLQHTVDSLGSRMDKQEQKVSFIVSFKPNSGHAYNVNITKNAPIVYDNLLHNMGGAYDVNTGRFTAPYPGIYSFTVHFMSSDGGVVHLGIAWSTTSRTGYGCHAYGEGGNNDNADQGSCTAILHLAEGSQVYVTTDYHQDAHPVIWSSFSYFSGFLLYPE